MTTTEYRHDSDEEFVTEVTTTETQTSETVGHIPYRQFWLSADDRQVVGDGTDTETISVGVVSGLDVARGTSPANATTLSVTDDATIVVDGAEQTVSLSSGTATLDVQTTRPAGARIDVEAIDLASSPADSATVQIEVI